MMKSTRSSGSGVGNIKKVQPHGIPQLISDANTMLPGVVLADDPQEWFSMEIQTFVVTATGREIHISKLTQVLSFVCVCPKCGERFTDEVSLKLHSLDDHADKTSSFDMNAEIDISKPTACADKRITGGNTNIADRSDDDLIEVTAVIDDSLPDAENGNDQVSPGKEDRDLGDNESISSQAENDSFEADNHSFEAENDALGADNDTLEAGNDTFQTENNTSEDANRATSFKGNKKRTSMRKKSTFTREKRKSMKGDKSHSEMDNTNFDQGVTVGYKFSTGADGKKRFRCTDCGRAYSRIDSLNSHRRIHDGHVYKCDKCDKQLSSITALRAHSKLHLEKRPYSCTNCDLGFFSQARLDEHNRNHRIESLISQYKNPDETTAESSRRKAPRGRAKVSSCECEICGLKLSRRQKYIEHMFIHTGEKPHVCAICGEAFRGKGMLNAHYRTHLGEDECKCQECGKQFLSVATLKAHGKTHTGERPYVCSICEKAFTKKDHLKVHITRHTRQFSHYCQDCGKSFPTRWALKSHRWSHTGEKPYLCPTCGKGFTGQSRLKEHMLIHTGEKPYVCDVCGKAFNQPHCLKEHVTTHEDNPGVLCSSCGKSCKHRSALNAHVRSVHRDKTAQQPTLMPFQNTSDFF